MILPQPRQSQTVLLRAVELITNGAVCLPVAPHASFVDVRSGDQRVELGVIREVSMVLARDPDPAVSKRPTLAALPDQSGIHCQQVIGQLPTFLVVMCS
jgi:hypothetical protein